MNPSSPAAALNPSGPGAGPVLVGSNDHRYSASDSWHRLPEGVSWTEAVAVACDSRDRIHVFNRGTVPVIVFDREGNLIHSWGQGKFARAHGLTIGPDDSLYFVDDLDHTVKKYSPEGELLMVLGNSGRPSDTGAVTVDYRTITRAAGPFNFPTNLAVADNGDLFVADGYGNARVHRFSADGRWILSWGEPGAGRGQFHVPHGIAIDPEGRICVADRENSRIQWFDTEGRFLESWDDDLARPSQMVYDPQGHLIIAELGYRSGIWPGSAPYPAGAPGGRISIYNQRRELLARWGGGENPTAPGDFFATHDLCLDSAGNLYVAEVPWSAGGRLGIVPADCHSLHKFTRL